MSNEKRDYIIKTLSRTKRKDYENYVINGIWHKIDDLNLRPITQQYVKRLDGKYGLIDMYFPQINFGIECDESHHKLYVEDDLKRQLSMEELLSTVEETADFVLRRVDVDQSIENIDFQIRSIVNEIKMICNEKRIQPWNFDEDIINTVLSKKYISFGDNVRFRTIVEISRLFGKNYKAMQRGYFKLDNDNAVWCPKMSLEIDGEKVSTSSSDWINYLSEDWKTISETRLDITKIKPLLEPEKINRFIFAFTIDPLGRGSYRYLGVYRYSDTESRNDLRVYKKIEYPIIYNNISFIQ